MPEPSPSLPPAFLARCGELLGPRGCVEDPAELELHSTDFWRQTTGRTPLLLRPADTGEVAAVVGLAAEHGVALVPQGGHTGLQGGATPDTSGTQAVLSLARMDRIRAVDAAGGSITVEAGCILAAVQAAALAADRLFPLSFGSEGTCRIGGNLGTNAGGLNVIRYGMARDLVLGLEVVLADGRVWDGLRTLRKDNTGYDLKQLFVGSEGSLGVVTAAALKLYPLPRERVAVFLGVPSPAAGVELLAHARGRFGELVSGFELIVDACVDAAVGHVPGVRFPLEGKAPWYVLAEIGWSLPEGLEAAVDAWLEAMIEAGLVLDATRAQNEAQRLMLWAMREGVSEATNRLGSVSRQDVSVAVARTPELVERGQALVAAEFPEGRLIPFGHVGDGNLHFNVVLPPDLPDLTGVRKRLQGRVYDLVQDMGGSISAEHGIGRAKRAELHARKDPLDIELMRRLKAALDPRGILNPGVIV